MVVNEDERHHHPTEANMRRYESDKTQSKYPPNGTGKILSQNGR